MIRPGRKNPKHLHSVIRGMMLYARLLSLAGIMITVFIPKAWAERAPLPVACGGSACVAKGGPTKWITSGAASMSQTGTTLNIHQETDKAVLNWEQFNIDAGHAVNFQQPASTSVAVNRVWDPTANPSTIMGTLTANGQVYLINRNGIVFGKDARVNTNTFIGSSVDITDKALNEGILSPINEPGTRLPAFLGTAVDSQGIVVESGAEIVAANGGKIMLFGGTVQNDGTLHAVDGQIILAAGDKIYLQGSTDPQLRGLWVEVDRTDPAVASLVTNNGTIISERGNVTLTGLLVNQNNRITATSAIAAGGSIYLRARNGAQTTPGQDAFGNKIASVVGTVGGEVTLGAGSVTEIGIADDGSTAARNTLFGADGKPLNPSVVDINGAQVHLESGSTIRAPGGNVALTAYASPAEYLTNANYSFTAPNDSAIRIDSGASIDVSGITATAAMERNQLEIFLTQNELNDYPEQRDGVLYRETVYVDARKGTTVANIQPYLDNIAISVSEVAAQGGSVAINSEGSVNVAAGATIDVSGGQVDVAAGYIKTTKLVDDGRVYDISSADPLRSYDGVAGEYSRHSNKWGVTDVRVAAAGDAGEYQRAYTEGKSAGTLSVQGHRITLDGELVGHTVAGDFQRDPASAPQGGQLIIGSTDSRSIDSKSGLPVAYRAPDVRFSADKLADVAAHPDALLLDTRFIDDGGFTRLDIRSDGSVELPRDLALDVGPGGSVKIVAREVNVDGDITAAGGTIALRTVNYEGDTVDTHHALTLGADARLDVAGRWINDNPELSQPGTPDATWIKGGSVSLQSADDLYLKDGSVINASGGAWLKADGSLKAGDGGSIDIAAHQFSGTGTPDRAQLELGAELSAWSLGKGGKLAIKADEITIQSGAATPEQAAAGTTVFTPEFFAQGGFQSFTLFAARGDLNVADGTQLNLVANNRVLDDAAYRLRATGTPIDALTTETRLRADQRRAVDLTLKHEPRAAASFDDAGTLHIGDGARIATEAGGALKLSSATAIHVDGELAAPAGSIQLELTKLNPLNGAYEYRAEREVRFGDQARVDATGAVELTPNAQDLRRGDVHNGGVIQVNAFGGGIAIEDGAVLDVSGTATTLDIADAAGRAQPTEVASAAGTITLAATESLDVAGELRGRGGAADAAGGTLNVTLERTNNLGAEPGFAPTPRELHVTTGASAHSGATTNGIGTLDTDTFSGGGFDQLALRAENSLVFDGDVRIDTRRAIALDAPQLDIHGDVQLHTAYAQIGNLHSSRQRQGQQLGDGAGTLSVAATQLIDLRGNMTINGASEIELHSGGDVRAGGVRDGNGTVLQGALTTAANITVQADQIYPTTLTDYSITVTRDGGTITVLPGDGPAPVLSAGGTLHLNADHIRQSGVIKAPLGTIDLNAGESLTLAPGSITSVSAENQLIPFGRTENGDDWLYDLPGGDSKLLFDAPSEKNVLLSAPDIDVQDGATIDLSGGGDVFAYENLPVTNDPKDVFAGGDGIERYAIVPGYNNGVAPFDPHYAEGTTLQYGDSIYLSGVNGLPDGEYTLLPARYAVLPGAYVVEPLAGYRDLAPGQELTRVDGAQVAYGYRTVAGTDIRDGRSNGFLVRQGEWSELSDGTDVFTYGASRYAITGGNQYFADQAFDAERAIPYLPQDAGHLTLDARATLNLDGELRVDSASGRGATLDITGERIAVVDDTTQAEAGFVAVDAQQLNGLGAESILIGGTRDSTDDGVHIDVSATEVRVGDDVALRAPELLLAARDEVNVGTGAKIRGDGAGADTGVISVDGDGALLRATGGTQAALRRGYDDGATIGTTGALNIGAEAVVSGHALILDASRDFVSQGEFKPDAGGSLNLGASRISLGDVRQGTTGLTLSAQQVQQLGADELVLTSRGGVDVYGPVTLNTRALTIDAPALTGVALNSGDTVTVQAEHLTLTNHNTTTGAANTAPGSGTLHIDSATTEFAQGDYRIAGFDQVRVDASTEILGSGAANVRVGGELTLNTPRITGTSGADLAITSADTQARAIRILNAPRPAEQAANAALGASLNFFGSRIDVDGAIDAAAGEVRLIATGADASDGVTLGEHANVNVGAVARDFVDVTKYADAGKLVLESKSGDVTIAAGANVNLAGVVSDKPGRGGGDAGELVINARNGEAHLDGDIDAHAVEGNRGGRIELDVAHLSGDYAALDTTLRDAGFTEQQHLHVRSGDVTVQTANDAAIVAHDYQLVVDRGNVEVRADIDASGTKGGTIEIWSGSDLTLRDGAQLDASADGANARGGRVLLAAGGASTATTRVGKLALEQGSAIDVSGTGTRVDSGEVTLRAPRTANGGVALDTLASTIHGADEIVVETVRVHNATTLDAATQNTLKTATQTDMSAPGALAAAQNLRAQLESALPGSGANLNYRPGVEVRSSGNLTVSSDWNLSDWRYGAEAQPGTLTLRAQGDLVFARSLSDGFVGTSHKDRINDSGESWSYRLVGGADNNSADAMATTPYDAAATGNVIVEAGTRAAVVGREAVATRLVRTGAGNIAMAAARDVILKNQQSMIYTAGTPAGRRNGAPGDTAYYGTGGGDVSIRAGGDVRMNENATTINPDQLPAAWLHREGGTVGRAAFPAAWWVNTKYFQQNIGALGGGDVRVASGRDIANISAVTATSKAPGESEIVGGGDLVVTAGRDIKGGVFFVGAGDGRIAAGGAIRDHRTGGTGQPVYPVLALGDAQLRVTARQDLHIQSVLNPTAIWRSAQQTNAAYTETPAKRSSYLFGYAPDSGVDVASVSGIVHLANNITAFKDDATMSTVNGADKQEPAVVAFVTAPPNYSATALDGDVQIDGRMTLFPAPEGTLELIAHGSVIQTGKDGTQIVMSDADLTRLPTVERPMSDFTDAQYWLGTYSANYHAPEPVHRGDAEPVRIIALTGDVFDGDYFLAKRAEVYAGRDVRDVNLYVQNIAATDTTSIRAGRDLVYSTPRDAENDFETNDVGIRVSGPGQLLVQTGRDVDLGSSNGIVTDGNLTNPNLAVHGASVAITAGAAQLPDYDKVLERLLPLYQNDPERNNILWQSISVALQDPTITELALDRDSLARELLFAEMKYAVSGGRKDHNAAHAVIDDLFSGTEYDGDIKLFLSQIRTMDGGDIDLLAPGGAINAGLAAKLPGFSKGADVLGIVAQDLGRVRAYSRDDFLVNQSRVFTLRGGDILLWSREGNVDAGRGAKSVTAAPQPTYQNDANGNTVVILPAAAQGSGIGIIVSNPADMAGDATLVAPQGIVNAGDAGITVAGNLNVSAQQVLGADNIKVGGDSSGVPLTGGSDFGSGLSGLGDAAGEAGQRAAEAFTSVDNAAESTATPLADAALTFLEVEVLGYGDAESADKRECPDDDQECKNRVAGSVE